MKKNREYVTDEMQEVAVDILTHLILAENMKEIYKVYDRMFEKYCLKQDPYTFFPCTTQRYNQNRVKFDKKVAKEKFSHQYIACS